MVVIAFVAFSGLAHRFEDLEPLCALLRAWARAEAPGRLPPWQLGAGVAVAALPPLAKGLYDLPRAVGLDGESLRAYQSIGLGERVHGIVQPPRDGDALWFTDSKRNKLFGIDTAQQAGHNGCLLYTSPSPRDRG